MANVQIISEKLALLRDFFSKIYHFGAFHPILETLY